MMSRISALSVLAAAILSFGCGPKDGTLTRSIVARFERIFRRGAQARAQVECMSICSDRMRYVVDPALEHRLSYASCWFFTIRLLSVSVRP
jgi:hypothetical protein